MLFDINDTIVAIASAAGPAARTIVRLSGPWALTLAGDAVAEELANLPGFRAMPAVLRLHQSFGRLRTVSEVEPPLRMELPCRVYLFRAPRSYTRQDVVELHVPGEVVGRLLVGELVRAGARPAQPGEFTARAFFNGRLDLARAEAVADIIDAEADAQLRSAVGVLEGALGRVCLPAAEALTEALALVEASIDFAEDGVELRPPDELAAQVDRAAARLEEALAAAGRWTPALAEPRVAIAGRPNAGKSSLLNALSGADRAIVSALAGTTRDVLSAPARLADGREVLLLDAAGLQDHADELWQAAHRAARQALASAEAVLFVADAPAANWPAEAALLAEVAALNRRAALVVLAAKCDQPYDATPPAELARRHGADMLAVSSHTGVGLDELRALLARRLEAPSADGGQAILLHDRQREALHAAAGSAERAAGLLASADAVADVAELAAVELRQALAALGQITGQVATEEVLAAIFARFCIGK